MLLLLLPLLLLLLVLLLLPLLLLLLLLLLVLLLLLLLVLLRPPFKFMMYPLSMHAMREAIEPPWFEQASATISSTAAAKMSLSEPLS